MNKKLIPICLFIICFAFILVGCIALHNFYSQPLSFAEDTITLGYEGSFVPAQKPAWQTFCSDFIPYVLVAGILSVLVCFVKKHWQTVKRHLPKVLCVVLCALCVGGSLLISFSLAETSFTPVDPSQYYGRKQLEKMANSSSLLYAYEQMVDGIEEYSSEIKVRNVFNSVTFEEWQVVLYCYLYDYPQHFWMDSSYRYSYIAGSNGEIIVHAILPNYAFTEAELSTARKTFNNEANEILSTLSPSMSEYDLEISIHDQLCARIVYQDSKHAHNAYGGLVTGSAVCEGYGKAYQYLLNQVGIESTLSTGTGTPSGSNITENHAWNLIKIDGDYYYTDLTWDDQNEPYYGYFNVTTAMLEEDHSISTFPYSMPLCTATKQNYFVKNDKVFSSFDLEKMVEVLSYNLTSHVYITGNANKFNDTVLNNSKAILTALDMVTSSTVRISSLGRERVVTVVGHRRGDVNGDNILDHKDVTLIEQYLTNSSVITDANCLKAADFNKDGKVDTKDSQKLANHIDGIVVDEPSSVPSSTPVSSTPVSSTPSSTPAEPSIPSSDSSQPSSDITPPVPSLALGDVNGDNAINAKDALTVLRIAVGKYSPTQDEITAADVNKDSAVNAKDALEILKKSVGKPCCF